MKKFTSHLVKLNPMAIFWLGVLTGALVVGLAFLYRGTHLSDGDAAVLRYSNYAAPAYSTYSESAMNYMVPPPTIY